MPVDISSSRAAISVSESSPRRRSRKGPKGRERSGSKQSPRRTTQPSCFALPTVSSTRRDLPIPASPVTSTVETPASSASMIDPTRADSTRRPTVTGHRTRRIGTPAVRGRSELRGASAALESSEGVCSTSSRSRTPTGSGTPFKIADSSPPKVKSPRAATRPAAADDTSVSAAPAQSHSRLAMTTGSPTTSSPSRLTSPAWTPTRSSYGSPPRGDDEAACMPWATRSAPATEVNVATRPSPVHFTTTPPSSVTSSLSSSRCAARTSAARSSPRAATSAVDPTMSTNSSVSVPDLTIVTPPQQPRP